VFGNKYVSFRSPANPSPQRISSADVIEVSHVTTEFNTLFETLTSISEKVDPVKLNLTLSAAAEALNGLGTKFGQSVLNGNAVLDDINPQMPQIRSNIRQLANLADVYKQASPDFWDFLDHAVTTAGTLDQQQGDLDAALLASTGFGNTGADVFERGAPYFIAGQRDLVTTSRLLDTYSPELFCMIRNYATSKAKDSAGGNGYSIDFHIGLTGAPNPYVYPDNLPRVNAKGGPGGAPGCWQEITHDFWPAPYLVADYGASLAPYNHFELGQPILTEYVWGRQVGENTINP
jgi:phospholipid/cholesterol/gamma-HCH transport system substrate-binding protein